MNQIEKNTVSAKGQLKDDICVSFLNRDGAGRRFLLVGNSITHHGIKPEIGWNRECGMAATSVDKDYVHLLYVSISKKEPDAVFCLCQVSGWERTYMTGQPDLGLYQAAVDFEADVIVMRCVENCPWVDYDAKIFETEYCKFIDKLNKSGKASVILTSGFWKHPCDSIIEKIAKDRNYPYIYLGDLGQNDKMKAIGLFEHTGVANHPGDEGMKEIAKRIEEKII